MGSSIFLAKLMGPYCLIVAAGVLLNLKYYRKVVDDFLKNSALSYIGGVIALLFGLLVILNHNIWSGWPLIITLFGWLSFIKGLVIIVFPGVLPNITAFHLKSPAILVFRLVLVMVLGLMLTIFGYFVG